MKPWSEQRVGIQTGSCDWKLMRDSTVESHQKTILDRHERAPELADVRHARINPAPQKISNLIWS